MDAVPVRPVPHSLPQPRRRGHPNGNLRAEYDVIVLPDMPPQDIVSGRRAGSMPPEYIGGLGEAGTAAIKAFVQSGGTLVCLDSSGQFAIDALNLPIKDDGPRRIPGRVLLPRLDRPPRRRNRPAAGVRRACRCRGDLLAGRRVRDGLVEARSPIGAIRRALRGEERAHERVAGRRRPDGGPRRGGRGTERRREGRADGHPAAAPRAVTCHVPLSCSTRLYTQH